VSPLAADARFSEEAQDYLIDYGRRLSKKQRLAVQALIEELADNPHLGEKPENPKWILCDACVARHIGSRLYIVFYYDIENYLGKVTIRVRAVRFRMTM
jgi:plasmid stabilization system protein ParE